MRNQHLFSSSGTVLSTNILLERRGQGLDVVCFRADGFSLLIDPDDYLFGIGWLSEICTGLFVGYRYQQNPLQAWIISFLPPASAQTPQASSRPTSD